MILHGDCLEELKTIPDNSVDTVITDPPYGYSFMGKDWDKAVPAVEIWHECLRVLKPGAFCLVMSAPRSDVQQAMTERLIRAGFRLDFTPIYWTYASGFPKAGNIGKLVDKRLGVERDITGIQRQRSLTGSNKGWKSDVSYEGQTDLNVTSATSREARALDGSYAGFQPKPAVEVVIVAMKPLDQKTYVDQALSNGHGVSWLDDARIGTGTGQTKTVKYPDIRGDNYSQGKGVYKDKATVEYTGRFPANLLVSDNILEDHSKYFDLDKWYEHALSQFPTFPFLIVPKASKGEKNKGLDMFEDRLTAGLPLRAAGGDKAGIGGDGSKTDRVVSMKNHHPTVKPLKLMSYLVTLFSRPGDTVLDPFVGSGTTVVAAKQLGREGIGIEREAEYVEIARAREAHHDSTPHQVSLL